VAQSSKAAKRERQRQNRAVKLEQQAAVEKRQRFWRSARGFIIILVPIAALFLFFALRGGGDDSSSDKKTSDKSSQSSNNDVSSLPAPSGITIDLAKTYTATIETTEGTIEIALDAANAPTSVNNFVYLTKAGFYDGLLFNRAAKNFVIQTGSPDNTTVGGPGYTVEAELPTSAYEVGSVAWAKAGNEPAGTAGSQFFIGTGSNVTSLPKDYGYIGKVTKGLDVAQKIMGFAPSSGDGKPTTNVKMTKVTITQS
jgi:cyclophilin family peptidyl-prolyl cis-trans isomerase